MAYEDDVTPRVGLLTRPRGTPTVALFLFHPLSEAAHTDAGAVPRAAPRRRVTPHTAAPRQPGVTRSACTRHARHRCFPLGLLPAMAASRHGYSPLWLLPITATSRYGHFPLWPLTVMATSRYDSVAEQLLKVE